MKIIRFIASLLPLVAIVLVVVQLVVSNALAGAGKNTQSLDQAIEDIKAQNQLLRQELAVQTSLIAIETKAKELGFTSAASTVTLAPSDVAYNRSQ
ncbi:hypothetical protein HY086_06895 [Candidatus Gottesmanbacteria bacterium]|nr:hypothetical protein [Candidatus Gottesmanbacteria bacterium]